VTTEEDTIFSDIDISREELCFIPATHIQDFPKQQDKFLESSLNLVVNNNSRSSLSEKAEPNGHLTTHTSSLIKGNCMVAQYSTKFVCILIIKTLCLDKR
jgi:COMPASS component SWD1